MDDVEFIAWPKIPRGQLENVTITEKIDGTNACVIIKGGEMVGVQSRKRLITPEDDNYGFAKWAWENSSELSQLGDGYHYGEWAGVGIQKNPHNFEGRKFLLFNTHRYGNAPECCDVVPILYEGPLLPETIKSIYVRTEVHAKGYTPEGIVVWYHGTRRYEKYTFKTPQGKWANL